MSVVCNAEPDVITETMAATMYPGLPGSTPDGAGSEAQVPGGVVEDAIQAELEDIVESVTHALRSPLWAIDGFLRPALEQRLAELEPAFRDDLQLVLGAAERMTRMVNALARLAGICQHAPALTRVDLSAAAQVVGRELQHRHAERCVQFRVEPGLCVRGDHQLLQMALAELLQNAWKFTQAHPTAHISFGACREPDPDAPVAPGQIVLCVRDDGVGFNPNHTDRLFHPFQRLHPQSQFEGLGMGLVFVRRIVHKHGGRIWARSQAQGGAAFFFTLAGPV